MLPMRFIESCRLSRFFFEKLDNCEIHRSAFGRVMRQKVVLASIAAVLEIFQHLGKEESDVFLHHTAV
jgi:hypothetical protein